MEKIIPTATGSKVGLMTWLLAGLTLAFFLVVGLASFYSIFRIDMFDSAGNMTGTSKLRTRWSDHKGTSAINPQPAAKS